MASGMPGRSGSGRAQHRAADTAGAAQRGCGRHLLAA
nr:hypothetical protein [Tanacetum cinerariifolium]